ncbi:MAG: 50S ribosomal protein L6 [Chloroflexota bacterium]
MSRIGKMPITVPAGVTVNIQQNEITVKGPKGELRRRLHPDMMIALDNNTLTVSRPSDGRIHRSLHGLTRTLVANMIEGVTKGFERELELVGVGFRTEKAGDKLVLRVGFTHPVEVAPLPGVSLNAEGGRIKVSGINKETVGEMAAYIRAIHPPDHYKGKGIRYSGETVHVKPGKTGKTVEGK